MAIVEVILTESVPIIGKMIKDLKLPTDSIIISIIRGNDVIIPKGDSTLQLNDSVLALTLSNKEEELRNIFLNKPVGKTAKTNGKRK